MHDERRVAGKGVVAAFLRTASVIGALGLREVRHIVTRPLPFCLIPPDEFFPFAPWRSVGGGRSAVVENAPIERPRVAPAVTVATTRSPTVGLVLAVVNAGVDPAAGSGRAIGLEFSEVLDGGTRRMRDEG